MSFFQREWGQADDLFQSMCQPRGPVRPNAVTFGIMIGAHLARDQPHKAKQLLSSMASECGIQPSSISFLALFTYYTNKGIWDEAIVILGHMCR